MCDTCGCSSGSDPRLIVLHDGKEPAGGPGWHTHADGTRHRHGHPHEDGHPHDDVHAADHIQNTSIVRIEQDLLAKNTRLARHNRQWLDKRSIYAINLMSSPGAGKTTLLERTIPHLLDDRPVSVIEGDQETTRDAQRIQRTGCRVVQFNTGGGCHLDAQMVQRGLEALAPLSGSLLFIENVGNLVCPALFDLGEHARVVIVSVTEGEDKPLKYPQMFRGASLMLLNKVDLLPYLEFDMCECIANARAINPELEIIPLSATRGTGMDEWRAWLACHAGRNEPVVTFPRP